MSNIIQNDFIEAMSKAVRDNIVSKVKNADVFSFLMNVTIDRSHVEQVSIILRYTFEGEVTASFSKFQNVDRTDVRSLAKVVFNVTRGEMAFQRF